MAGGHKTKFADLVLHGPKRWQALTGKGMCIVMWYSLLLSSPFVACKLNRWELDKRIFHLSYLGQYVHNSLLLISL